MFEKNAILTGEKIKTQCWTKKSVPSRENIKTINLTKKLFWLEKKLKQYAWQKSFSE